MEYSKQKKSVQKKGFVTFKMSESSRNDEDQYVEKDKTPKFNTVKIPNHVRQKMSELKRGPEATSKATSKASTTSKGSKEYRSAAEKLRAELAELKRKKEMLSSPSNPF